MHESEFWLSRCWGLFSPPHKNGVAEAKPFRNEQDREAWIAQNPAMRKAVGKRHPVVKALRQRWDEERRTR